MPDDTQKLSDGAAAISAGNAALNTKVQEAIGSADKLDDAATAAITDKLGTFVADGTLTPEQAGKIGASLTKDAASPSVTELKGKLATDATNVQKLADGAAAIAAGAAKFAGATPTLNSAISQVHAGAGELTTGAGTLADGPESALDGANQLSAGAAKLDTGAGDLKTGSGKLLTGASELSTQLRNGAGTVPDPNDKAKENAAGVIADPIRVDSVSQARAANYGSGLAPFFLVLALWIGGLVPWCVSG